MYTFKYCQGHDAYKKKLMVIKNLHNQLEFFLISKINQNKPLV